MTSEAAAFAQASSVPFAKQQHRRKRLATVALHNGKHQQPSLAPSPRIQQQQQGETSLSSETPSTSSSLMARSSTFESDPEDGNPKYSAHKNSNETLTPSINKRGIALSLSLTYFTVMGAKCALPSVLPLLVSDVPGVGLQFAPDQNPQSCMAQLLGLSTLAVAVGKLVLGPLIDATGGSTFLKLTLVILTSLFGFLSVGNSTFGGFFIAWMTVDFIFSSCWASCINAIHQYFEPREWSTLIGNLATGARAGNAVAFAVFAQVLQWCTLWQSAPTTASGSTALWPSLIQSMASTQPWRVVFGLSAVAQLLPLSLLLFYCRRAQLNSTNPSPMESKTQQQSHKETQATSKSSFSTSLALAWKEAQRPDFWMHFVSRSVLMVFASFLLFVPTYMCSAFGTTSAFASQTGSVFALGCLLAVTIGTRLYNSFIATTPVNATIQKNNQVAAAWAAQRKTLALTGMMATAALSSAAQWAYCANRLVLSPAAGSALFFVWGLSMAIPFYIPPSLYALNRGGTECSATIMDLFDIGGFGLLATFNGYVAGISSSSAASSAGAAAARALWVPTFAMTTTCALLSLLSLGMASWREQRVGDHLP